MRGESHFKECDGNEITTMKDTEWNKNIRKMMIIGKQIKQVYKLNEGP